MLQAKEALSVGNGTGEARWWFGTLAEIKATAADTGGLCTIVEVTCGPGYKSALHVHHREDEGFWVLDGQVTLEVGGTKFEAGVGDYAFGPRGLPHRFKVGDQGCRRALGQSVPTAARRPTSSASRQSSPPTAASCSPSGSAFRTLLGFRCQQF